MGGTTTQTCINTIKLLTVEPYLFFSLFGYIVRLVSYQSLLIDRACRNVFKYSEEVCSNLDAHTVQQSECIEVGNNLYMTIQLLSSIPAIVVAIFLGPWSDKYSRKYPLIIAMTGMLLESSAGAILTAFTGISPIWFTVTALLSGITGGFVISVSAACSYLSDITDERSRPARFAVLEFFTIIAIICGSTIGGQVFNAFGYLAVMWLAPLGFGLGLLYTIFFVKETKPPLSDEVTRGDMIRDLFSLRNVKHSYVTCSKRRPGNIRLQIWLLVWIGASQKFVDMGTLAVGFSFAKKMYHWGVADFSNASTVFYVVNAFVTLAVVPALSSKLRLHEAAIGFVGVLSIMAKMTLTSVAYTGPYFYFAWISGTLANASGIAVRSRLSKLVNKEELGRAFSLLGTCESVTPLVGTVVFLQLYNASLNTFPGLTFAVAAILQIPSAVSFAWMMRMPTISLSEYAREDDMKRAKAMEDLSSTNYSRLEEENERY